MCRGFDFSLAFLGINTLSILEQRNFQGTGYQLQQHLRPLLHQLRSVHAHAGEIAARPVETGHETICNRVRAPNEKNRNCRGGGLRRMRRR
jgi:hypothetical protein